MKMQIMQPNLAPIPLLFDALRNSLHIENFSRIINGQFLPKDVSTYVF